MNSINGLDDVPDYKDIDSTIDVASKSIFENYPIFDESYRTILNRKILRHFYTREIGFETVANWKLHINNKMYEIMPYFNQLYESELLKFNPLIDTDLSTAKSRNQTYNSNGTQAEVRNSEQASSGTSENNVSNSSTDINKFQDTPQGAVGGNIDDGYTTNITNNNRNAVGNENGKHSSNINTSGNTTGSDTRSTETAEGYTERVMGLKGFKTASTMLNEFRTTFINIDMQIISQLESLFMGLWE